MTINTRTLPATHYAIKQISTGFLLECLRRSGEVKISTAECKEFAVPRLFRRPDYAKLCFDRWVKGIEDVIDGDRVYINPRDSADYEIVPVTVSIVQ